jgi:hypothetical protein
LPLGHGDYGRVFCRTFGVGAPHVTRTDTSEKPGRRLRGRRPSAAPFEGARLARFSKDGPRRGGRRKPLGRARPRYSRLQAVEMSAPKAEGFRLSAAF